MILEVVVLITFGPVEGCLYSIDIFTAKFKH